MNRLNSIASLASVTLLAACGTFGAETHDVGTAARLHVAAVAAAAGDTDIALAMYAGAAAQSPGDPGLQARYANALIDSGNPQAASAVLEKALDRESGSALLLRESAKLELESGHAEVALRRYEQALAVDPRDMAAQTGEGVALDMLGRHGDAQTRYRQVLSRSPDDVAASNDLALSLMIEGNFTAARQALERVARDPTAPARVRTNLALARAGSGQAEAASDLVGNALSSEQIAQISQLLPSLNSPQ